jgi:DUF1680 family protein
MPMPSTTEPEEGEVLDTVALTGTAYPVRTGSGRPYGPASAADGIAGAVPLTFVPYHRWGNRGPSAMRVWLPELRR